MSVSMTGASAFLSASALTAGSAALAWPPPRSAATRTGTCSRDKPRLAALPPRRRGLRSSFRAPLRLRRTNVSSASTIPRNFLGVFSTARKNRRRQRNAVDAATPHRPADARTVSPSDSDAPNESHRSLRCRPDNGAPVAALNVRPQPWRRQRRKPRARPMDTAPVA